MEAKIADIQKKFETDLKTAKVSGNFDELYLKYFSKSNGAVTALVKKIPTLDADSKKIFGPLINELQKTQKEAITQAITEFENAKKNDPLIDLTIPEQPVNAGFLHPITQTIREINEFFRYYGFSVYEGPEIETEEYNFRKLNLPKGHPATDLQDTLYVSKKEGTLLRTHTSSVEARVLTKQKPPIRVAFSGKCFRNETPNATNAPFFHQYQGVVVDKGITLQNLKFTLQKFHEFLFGDDVVLRFRYKYYPEVSPGMGVDMQCKFCVGVGCEVCKQRGYIEVLGSGMIHYNTLKMCGIDPDVYTGYAFGMGLDRLVMQKFEISDIRDLLGGGLVYK